MREIINYLRQVFCEHKFLYEERRCDIMSGEDVMKSGIKVSRTCEKCGWHKKYWKF